MVSVGEGNHCAWGGLGGFDAKECIQGVGNSLDLLNLEVLDGAKVKDGPVCGTNLEEIKEHDKEGRLSDRTSQTKPKSHERECAAGSRDKIGARVVGE